MERGTTFTTEVYISRQHFNTDAELEAAIKEYEDSIEWSEKRLLMFASATPKADIGMLHDEVEVTIENLKHDIREVEKLYQLRDVGLDQAKKE